MREKGRGGLYHIKVSELVADCTKDGWSICDPACGQAGLLIEAPARSVTETLPCSAWRWPEAPALARMNMFLLLGDDGARIECATRSRAGLVENDNSWSSTWWWANPTFPLTSGVRTRRRRPVTSASVGGCRPRQGRMGIHQPNWGRLHWKGSRVAVVEHQECSPWRLRGPHRQKMIEENLLDACWGSCISLPTTSIPVPSWFLTARGKRGVNED